MSWDYDDHARSCWVGENVVVAAAAIDPAFAFKSPNDLGPARFHPAAVP
jgi:hypothetical protein